MTAQLRIDTQTSLNLRIHTLWRALFALLMAASIFIVWSGSAETSLWQKVLLSLVAGLAAMYSVYGALQIEKRHHAGRMATLVLDYLGFVACFVLF